MQQLTVFEAINQRLNPKPQLPPRNCTHAESNARCRKGTAPHILAYFATLTPGQVFYLDDLTQFVRNRKRCAPDTPRRIADNLRTDGLVSFESVGGRDTSAYTFLGLAESEVAR